MFIKICGITTADDALLATALGADAVGFVLAPSKRQIAPPRVEQIVRQMAPGVLTVGVFRNESPKRVVQLVHQCGLKAAQLHGHESPEDTKMIGEQVPMVIKAFSGGTWALAEAHRYGADVVMVDSDTPGSGQVFDWALAENAPGGVRLLIAGGLTHKNVGMAIAKVRPWGVDVSTGVERSPGHKDPALLRAFITAARSAANDRSAQSDVQAGDGPYNWDEEQIR